MEIKNKKIKDLQEYFLAKNWIDKNENIVEVSTAGEGNMNCVLRIKTDCRSFICKQSSSYVEKYPSILAPKNRVQTEAAFYQKIKSNQKIQSKMPELFDIDTENNIMILEDLGSIQDFSSLYQLKNQLLEVDVINLVSYLNELHCSFKKEIIDDELANVELRQLNYEHIFNYPFLEENNFDLDTIQPGLQQISMFYKTNAILKKAVKRIGQHYLASDKYLLHGDFYPGSWFNSNGNIKIIDPEFCYFGNREFDLGVFIAHLYLTKQNEQLINLIPKNYYDYKSLNLDLLNGYIGIEILRRLIGLAQLPLKMELQDKNKLLEKAKNLILNK